MNRFWFYVICFYLLISTFAFSQPIKTRSEKYDSLQNQLAKGWNTWNTYSMMSHVLLPQGLGIDLVLKETGQNFVHTLDFNQTTDNETIFKPGIHSWDGSYTELNVTWRGHQFEIKSAVQEKNLYLLISPKSSLDNPVYVIAKAGFLWNRPGSVIYNSDRIEFVMADTLVRLYASKGPETLFNHPALTASYTLQLDGPVGFCTGNPASVDDIQYVIDQKKNEYLASLASYDDLADVYSAMISTVAWNTIYDPQNDRVITTPDRTENAAAGGWALYCGDSFLAAMMASAGNKELAFANIREMMNEITEKGFVPARIQANGFATLDRSHPPLAGLALKMIYDKYKETWLVEELFNDLLNWNRWWDIYRNFDGLLSPGSNPYQDDMWHDNIQNNAQAAILEVCMRNSPVYENVPFNEQTQMLELWDVGLNSLYIADCQALADLAGVLKKSAERELRARAKQYSDNLNLLLDQDSGMFLNTRADTQDKINKLSVTQFFPLLSGSLADDVAQRMIKDVMNDSVKFDGQYILPSLSRDNPVYMSNISGRGAVDVVANSLIYLGLRNYEFPDLQARLAKSTTELFMTGWTETGTVNRYYSSENGTPLNTHTLNVGGAIPGLVAIIQAGKY